MAGRSSIEQKILSFLRTRATKKRTIVVGLKSDNCSREMLLRLLNTYVKPEDKLLAVHVQEPFDTFDPNTFHIHEDLCKSKQVDFLVKVCIGDSYISELCQQVRVNHATILALGCNSSGPKKSVVNKCLKGLPPSCSLLVMDSAGSIIIQRQGTSQQGSTCTFLQSLPSSSSERSYFHQSTTPPSRQLQKSLTAPSISQSSTQDNGKAGRYNKCKKTDRVPDFMAKKLFHKLDIPEAEGSIKRFTLQELCSATNDFSPDFIIGEGGHCKVYRAKLGDGQSAAVKVHKTKNFSAEDFLQEMETLSCLKHQNIVQIIGYCESKKMPAILYNLLKGSLRQYLQQLEWSERMGVAIGVARALEYLHHSFNPPIIHRDVTSSNILLSDDCQPQLSDFGAAILHNQSEQISTSRKPFDVIGTFGYLAPEYMMCGNIDEKVDVYSYGVVLLELITGKEAVQTNQANRESLVLWARSLLSSGLCERLIDPNLNKDYKKEEMETMMFAARLCLIHSSSRRPTMKTILRLFVEPEYWKNVGKEKIELLSGINSNSKTYPVPQDDAVASVTFLTVDDAYNQLLVPEETDQ